MKTSDQDVYQSYVKFCKGIATPMSFIEWSFDRDNLSERSQEKTDFTSEMAAIDVPQTLAELNARWSEGRLLKTKTALMCLATGELIPVAYFIKGDVILTCGHIRTLTGVLQ
jgi:hypothetical protein